MASLGVVRPLVITGYCSWRLVVFKAAMELGDEDGINAGENNTKAAILTKGQLFSFNKCSSEYY